ncbi:MAG: exodeoxyribonuclease V subunit alpha [Proteobacteria bacterium]|nr:exodeoxyribonuclease V subunit alpha [Pseudomonadota bacterium]
MLDKHIEQFFQALTDNEEVIDLAVAIQQQLGKGHTAIKASDDIDDKLISPDGSYGYIVQTNGLAGFRRFYNQEQDIANDFKKSKTISIEPQALEQALEFTCKLLKCNKPTEPDKQREDKQLDKQWQASFAFLRHNRYILSGGPGTGKTTTMTRMLLMFSHLYPTANIALAAPTGKAANHMMQSMNKILPTKYQETAQTIHRLLGYNHQQNTVKFTPNNPLSYDLVIIDEASMLDVTLTNALIKALKPTAQLLLIGDKNQLPAVAAGNIFADLCKIHTNNLTELSKNFRFKQDSKIAQLCESIIQQDQEKFNHVHNTNNPTSKQEKLHQLKQWYKKVATDSAIILSPVKHGNNSVNELNQLAIEILHKHNKYHENMPIIVNQNDYALGIFNGDIGALQQIDNQWQVPFQSAGKIKHIKLDAIKDWQIAHATTIHKAQGSEYDHVLLAIPDDLELEILTNSLLYTAISRAKKSITLWASDEILEKTIKTKQKRLTFIQVAAKISGKGLSTQ